MNFLKKLTPFTLPLLLAACGDDDLDTSIIQAPDTYEFTSLTDPSASSSVAYEEVTTQIVLIKELEYLIGSGHLQTVAQSGGDQAVIDLLNRIYDSGSSNITATNVYNSSSAATPINGVTTTLDKLQADFSSMHAGVNLKSKMPGVNTDLIYRDSEDSSLGNLLGWSMAGILNKDEDELSDKMIQDWFANIAILARNSPDTTTYRSNAMDYQALVTSYLSTALPYFQVTNILLNPEVGLTASNSSQTQYTALQHNWDLAFAYFGASRHYKIHNKAVNASVKGVDSNGDERINLFTEFNFIHARNAAELDNNAELSDTNFSQNIMQAFLNGRQLIDEHITTNNDELLTQINIQADIICKNWERIMAAQLIHHINLTTQFIGFYGQSPTLDDAYAKNWAYAKSYAIALQFNPNSIITFEELTATDSIHSLMTQTPETRVGILNTYKNKLLIARNQVATTYGFSDRNTLAW